MIEVRNLRKVFRTNGVNHVVADRLNVTFPRGKVTALLGGNGVGKSTLLGMISGAIDYDGGDIIKHGTVSWPVGYAGSFHKDLTGVQNVRFLGRVYGVDTDELVAFVDDFAELGKYFNLPIDSYSSGMRSRLSFAVSMGVPFDTYLVDEVMAVGDTRFKEKCRLVMEKRFENRSAIIVSHSDRQISELCDCAVILKNRQAKFYDNLENALEIHRTNMETSGEMSERQLKQRIAAKRRKEKASAKEKRLDRKAERLAIKALNTQKAAERLERRRLRLEKMAKRLNNKKD